MTDKIVRLINDGAGLRQSPEEADLLAVALSNLDNLRESLVSGRIKAFFAVGIAPDHSTFAWSGKSKSTTVLEFHGAWHTMAERIDDIA